MLPVLGLLRGAPAVLLVGLGVIMALPDLAASFRVPRSPPAWSLALIAVVLYGGIGSFYVQRLQASGDEPHYLLMAQSLWEQGDLDLRDNYERQDFLEYTPGPVRPHYGAPRADGRPYPAHSPGLPFLLAPIYAFGGRTASVLLLALLAGLLTGETYRLAREFCPNRDAPLVGWAAALGAPVLFYAFHVYSEVPSALAIVSCLRILTARRPSWQAALLAALCASWLPWLHAKNIAVAAALGIIAAVRLGKRPRLVFLAVAAAACLGYVGYYQAIFGQPTPLAIYGGLPRQANGVWWRASLGLLLDRSFGLLPHAPLFLLGVAGLAGWARRAERAAWPLALTLIAVVAPILVWRMWWGGYCPPSRFLVPAVPILAVAVAARVSSSPRGLAHWRWVLAALGLILALYMVHRPVDRLLLDRRAQPTRTWIWLSDFEEPSLNHYLPSLISKEPAELRVVIIWCAGLLVLLGLDALACRRRDVDRLFRGLELPIVLLLLGGSLVDVWARAPAANAVQRTDAGERPVVRRGTSLRVVAGRSLRPGANLRPALSDGANPGRPQRPEPQQCLVGEGKLPAAARIVQVTDRLPGGQG
jgi:hypothetical protein